MRKEDEGSLGRKTLRVTVCEGGSMTKGSDGEEETIEKEN
jgi:hypothetical protein